MAQSSEVAETIVKTVADYENIPPDDLPPLADKLDTETFRQLPAPDEQITEPLEFEYLFYNVTVLSDGEVIVTP